MKTRYKSEIEKLIDSYKDELQLIKKSIKVSIWNTTLEETKIETLERVIDDLERIVS